MRHLTLVVPVALLSLVTACGSSTPTTTPTPEAPAATTASPSSPSTSASPDDKGGDAAGEVLTGTLAPKDGFKIFLKDSSGKDVTTLKAGKYQVKIKDTSKIHNLHLTGPGGVDVKTTVPELTETTWPVTLTAGSYKFLCDPHPAIMTQMITVT